MTRSGGSSGLSVYRNAVDRTRHLTTNVRTTSLSYTSTALCIAVATGYSWICSNEDRGKFSANVEGTISGARPWWNEVPLFRLDDVNEQMVDDRYRWRILNVLVIKERRTHERSKDLAPSRAGRCKHDSLIPQFFDSWCV